MPRIANETNALLADFQRRLERLVETARKEGREEALAEVRHLVAAAGRGPGRPRKTATAAKPAKRKKKRKNPWANLTPEQRLKRVNAIRKGRGLPPRKAL